MRTRPRGSIGENVCVLQRSIKFQNSLDGLKETRLELRSMVASLLVLEMIFPPVERREDCRALRVKTPFLGKEK